MKKSLHSESNPVESLIAVSAGDCRIYFNSPAYLLPGAMNLT